MDLLKLNKIFLLLFILSSCTSPSDKRKFELSKLEFSDMIKTYNELAKVNNKKYTTESKCNSFDFTSMKSSNKNNIDSCFFVLQFYKNIIINIEQYNTNSYLNFNFNFYYHNQFMYIMPRMTNYNRTEFKDIAGFIVRDTISEKCYFFGSGRECDIIDKLDKIKVIAKLDKTFYPLKILDFQSSCYYPEESQNGNIVNTGTIINSFIFSYHNRNIIFAHSTKLNTIYNIKDLNFEKLDTIFSGINNNSLDSQKYIPSSYYYLVKEVPFWAYNDYKFHSVPTIKYFKDEFSLDNVLKEKVLKLWSTYEDSSPLPPR